MGLDSDTYWRHICTWLLDTSLPRYQDVFDDVFGAGAFQQFQHAANQQPGGGASHQGGGTQGGGNHGGGHHGGNNHGNSYSKQSSGGRNSYNRTKKSRKKKK